MFRVSSLKGEQPKMIAVNAMYENHLEEENEAHKRYRDDLRSGQLQRF
jgi:hypothetical protein